jgi:hypothetical protein
MRLSRLGTDSSLPPDYQGFRGRVRVPGDQRSKFGTPETSLRGKRICVTGQISDYHGNPKIVLADPRQLSQ